MSPSELSETAPITPLALIRPADLYQLYETVAGLYAFAPCTYLGKPNEDPAVNLGVEFSVHIRGSVQGQVTVRSTLAAARLLAEGLHVGGGDSETESVDAFRETCNLFVGHLLTTCLGGHRRAFEPFLPQPSQPAQWPQRMPDAACVLLLDTEPVELRYWQESL